jgi:hypothetical protein
VVPPENLRPTNSRPGSRTFKPHVGKGGLISKESRAHDRRVVGLFSVRVWRNIPHAGVLPGAFFLTASCLQRAFEGRTGQRSPPSRSVPWAGLVAGSDCPFSPE